MRVKVQPARLRHHSENRTRTLVLVRLSAWPPSDGELDFSAIRMSAHVRVY